MQVNDAQNAPGSLLDWELRRLRFHIIWSFLTRAACFSVFTLNLMTNGGDDNLRPRLGEPFCQRAVGKYRQILLKLFFHTSKLN